MVGGWRCVVGVEMYGGRLEVCGRGVVCGRGGGV